MQQAKNKFNQPNTAGQPNLVALQPSRAELLQLQFWSDFSEILDLRFWSTNKTTCWFSGESVKFWKIVGPPTEGPEVEQYLAFLLKRIRYFSEKDEIKLRAKFHDNQDEVGYSLVNHLFSYLFSNESLKQILLTAIRKHELGKVKLICSEVGYDWKFWNSNYSPLVAAIIYGNIDIEIANRHCSLLILTLKLRIVTGPC